MNRKDINMKANLKGTIDKTILAVSLFLAGVSLAYGNNVPFLLAALCKLCLFLWFTTECAVLLLGNVILFGFLFLKYDVKINLDKKH